MFNLEYEFEIIIRMARKNVADKVERGELTPEEATLLIDMINERTDDHSAWEPSGGYKCW